MQVYPDQLERGSEDDGNHYNSTISLPLSFGMEGEEGAEPPLALLTLRQSQTKIRRRPSADQRKEEGEGDDYLVQVTASGELDKFAGWHKASHPIQKLLRLLDCFALHSTSKKTSLYSRAILWYMALRFCCATSFLLYSPTNQYTSIAIITTMWQLLCLLIQATFLYTFRIDSLFTLYSSLCTDDTYPELSTTLRDALASSMRRITPIALAVAVGNIAFLTMISLGLFSYLFPATTGLALYIQAQSSYPLPSSPATSAIVTMSLIYATVAWLLGVAVFYWCMLLLNLRFDYIIARVKEGALTLPQIRAAHTHICVLVDMVDVAFQHFTTAWTLVGWALIIFQLSLVLLAIIDYVMWGAAIFWLAAGVGLQGVLAISAAMLQANHNKLADTIVASNQGLDDKLELLALLTRLKSIQPGMTALFRAIPMDWRFLLTVGSTVSSAFVLLNQIQKYGAKAATTHL